MSSAGKVVILGVTGASGAILAQTALRLLAADVRVARVHLVVSDAGLRLLDHELGIVAPLADLSARLVAAGTAENNSARVKIEALPDHDIGASIASGSYPVDAMCVIPCSMGMLSSIAAGASTDLISRAADVSLKEGRRLVLCIRDTPFSRIHIQNMLHAQQAGAVIMPAVPSFYHHPKTIDDLVTQYVCRVLAQLGLPQDGQFEWQGQTPNRVLSKENGDEPEPGPESRPNARLDRETAPHERNTPQNKRRAVPHSAPHNAPKSRPA